MEDCLTDTVFHGMRVEYMNQHSDALKRRCGMYYEKIQNLRIIDDEFMRKVLEDKECTQLVLRIIMDKPDLEIKDMQVQFDMKNLQGRSLRLDVIAVDSAGTYYNIEIQRDSQGAGRKRARYHSSLLDANVLDSGEKFEKLPESYVIFITEKDVLGWGLPVYHVDRIILENGEEFKDGSHIIYVNSKVQDDTELGKLMQDFWCSSADEMNYEVLAGRVRYFKETEKGVSDMSKVMEEIRREGREEGKTLGVTQINSLISRLWEAGRMEELARSAKDEVFQKQLLEEFML